MAREGGNIVAYFRNRWLGSHAYYDAVNKAQDQACEIYDRHSAYYRGTGGGIYLFCSLTFQTAGAV